MSLPDFILGFPSLQLPFPDDVVTTRAVRSDRGLVVVFHLQAGNRVLPPHAHKGQWGTVIEGSVELTIGDETRVYRPGDSYSILAGVTHSARIPAGAVVIDVFEEPDRYPINT